MTAIRDITCDLIQRPHERRRPDRDITMRDTPHGEALGDRIDEANAAITALLAMGCLIDHVKLTPGEVRIQLIRCPLSSALERHATHQWWYALAAPGEAMRGLHWRGVFVEWPVHASDVPNVEAVAS